MGSIFVDLSEGTGTSSLGSLNPTLFLLCVKKQSEINIFSPIHRKHVEIMVQDNLSMKQE